MRFWAYFAAKMAVAGIVMWGLLGVVDSWFPHAPTPLPERREALRSSVVLHDRVDVMVGAPEIQLEEIAPTPIAGGGKKADPAVDARLFPLRHAGQALAMNTTLMVWFLLCAGTLYVIVRDQRYRCRVCLRRLRMPVKTGSRGFMLQLGRPRTEYICPYGHGTLKEEDTATSVLDGPVWTRHSDDIWAELCATGKDDGDKN